MPAKAKLIRALTSPPLRAMRRLFKARAASPLLLTDPLHSDVPALQQAEIAAVYHGVRMAGDFYEFLRLGPSRVLFGLLDMAGRREDTREILIAAQRTLRTFAPKLFAGQAVNEPEAMIELCHQINRTILKCAGGVRSCPAFIGCYNEDLGTVCYASAGHTPALLRDPTGITHLEATGLPLGLFSHTTHSASTCALVPNAVLLVVSRGIVEAEHKGEEFGLQGVTECLRGIQGSSTRSARDLCLTILDAAQHFMRTPLTHNDVTALALLRKRSGRDQGTYFFET